MILRMGWEDLMIMVVSTLLLLYLLRPSLRTNSLWRATVTPLASIIGSGFLVIAPLLAFVAGRYAVVAIAAVLALAWLVGSAIRYNIRHLEHVVENPSSAAGRGSLFVWLEYGSKAALSIAYIIAIAFYLELLGAFLLRIFEIESALIQKSIATLLILFVGAVGLKRGLKALEGLEEYSVSIKLAIIGGFLIALAMFNIGQAVDGNWQWPELATSWGSENLFQILGAFLIVQGFETSRYLHGVYSSELRIKSMRLAQLISAVIYLLFIALMTPLFSSMNSISETEIIDLSAHVAWVLPLLLVIGAVMAQFSATVADTISSGGLVEEVSRGRVSHRHAYLISMLLVTLLLWTADIFEVVTYASRAFATYYALQCIMASMQAFRPLQGEKSNVDRGWLYAVLAMVMLLIALAGVPVEASS